MAYEMLTADKSPEERPVPDLHLRFSFSHFFSSIFLTPTARAQSEKVRTLRYSASSPRRQKEKGSNTIYVHKCITYTLFWEYWCIRGSCTKLPKKPSYCTMLQYLAAFAVHHRLTPVALYQARTISGTTGRQPRSDVSWDIVDRRALSHNIAHRFDT